MKKLVIATASSVVSLGLLSACSDSGSSATVTETVTSPAETVTQEASADDSAAPATQNQQAQLNTERPDDVPSSVAGYSTEAEQEMQEEGLTQADVDAVVKAAVDGEARVDWDDDGYFELEHQEIDVDITPEGEVLDVSR